MWNRLAQGAQERRIHRLGRLAAITLVPGARGTVIASTSAATYLESAGHVLLWMATEGVTLHRRAIQVVDTLPNVAPGHAFSVDGQRLRFSPGPGFDLQGTRVWDPDVPWRGKVASPSKHPVRLTAALARVLDLRAPDGFGRFLPAILGHPGGRGAPRDEIESAAEARAWPGVQAVCSACVFGDLPEVLARAEPLIGLGQGLTPSGDDFVGALLYTLRRMGEADYGLGRVDPGVLRLFLRQASGRTNAISHTLLSDHAHGHACEALQQLVDACLTGRDSLVIGRLAERLLRVGHSTGWDLLTGAAAAMVSTVAVQALRATGASRAAQVLPS